MSIKIMTWVFYEETQTHGEERLVLLALADQANDEGLTWPGVNRLAQKANTDRRSIPRALNQLIRKGLVTVEPRSENGRSLTNLYRIVWNEQIRKEEEKAQRLGVSPYKDPTSSGEGDSMTPLGEGDTVTPPGGHSDTLGVSLCQGEGDSMTPESLINHQLTANEPGEDADTIWRKIVRANAVAEKWWPAKENQIISLTAARWQSEQTLKITTQAEAAQVVYGISAQAMRARLASGIAEIRLEVELA